MSSVCIGAKYSGSPRCRKKPRGIPTLSPGSRWREVGTAAIRGPPCAGSGHRLARGGCPVRGAGPSVRGVGGLFGAARQPPRRDSGPSTRVFGPPCTFSSPSVRVFWPPCTESGAMDAWFVHGSRFCASGPAPIFPLFEKPQVRSSPRFRRVLSGRPYPPKTCTGASFFRFESAETSTAPGSVRR